MNLHSLIDAVQTNCHIADARHAREMTMCTYLLEMRDFYRWENDLPLTAPPPRDDLGNWLTEREAMWEGFETLPFHRVPVEAREFDPFDAEGINDLILDHGLVYGGGYGRFRHPHFFLGRLERRERRDGFTVLVSGCEYARDLTADPGAMRGDTIYVRREAVRRWLWTKAEGWELLKRDGALARALACYGFEGNRDRALERMTDSEVESIVLHELGEGAAGRMLGRGWERMLAGFSRRRPEIAARAARDNLADCLSTLPSLIGRDAECAIHFYFSNFDGMRKRIFPELDAAYAAWLDGRRDALREAVERGAEHWAEACRRLLDAWRADPAAAETDAETLVGAGQCCTAP